MAESISRDDAQTQTQNETSGTSLDQAWKEEAAEWLDAMDDVLKERGAEGARELMRALQAHLSHRGLVLTEA
ncbi:MAG: hypothetical protein AAGE43_18175, partial [Pseudomonadota bacterium]